MTTAVITEPKPATLLDSTPCDGCAGTGISSCPDPWLQSEGDEGRQQRCGCCNGTGEATHSTRMVASKPDLDDGYSDIDLEAESNRAAERYERWIGQYGA